MKKILLSGVALIVVLMGVAIAQNQAKKPVKPPMVSGEWTGTWGIYAPPKPGEEQKDSNKHPLAERLIDCKVDQPKDGKWQATFEGDCGRPYKYIIKMSGRAAGSAVLFQGTADLGEKDGGVFDWIGRATDTEFVGFFTSQGYTGTFRMARKK